MRSAWNMDRRRRPRIIRGLAGLFLLFTLVDILCPPACCERAELLSAACDTYSRLVAGVGDEASSDSHGSLVNHFMVLLRITLKEWDSISSWLRSACMQALGFKLSSEGDQRELLVRVLE